MPENMEQFAHGRVRGVRRAPDDQPFLKWAGGKRWLARRLASLLAEAPGRYFEPFVGSGAVYFALRPAAAVISDSNVDLIAAFKAVRDEHEPVVTALQRLEISREAYAQVRSDRPETDFARAVRLLYLNRTAYNGLWRVNRAGEFNVPFGCKPGTTSVDPARLARCARDLRNASVIAGDFRDVLMLARAGDSVYLDPPYTVTHNNNGFRRYNERIFSWSDQEALAYMANDLAERGCHVVVTNADHDDVSALYGELYARCSVYRTSRMAASLNHRNERGELVLASRSVVSSDSALVTAMSSA